jgi:acyl-CoA hydrolase
VNNERLTLRFLAEPTDVNFGGKVHGGAVMKWIDQGAYACAVGWAKNYCVTVYVGGIRFFKPITIGSIVEVQSRVIYTGKTSLHISVDVRSRAPKEEIMVLNTHCIIVFVSVDDEGNPVPVKQWEPNSAEEAFLRDYAIRLMNLRKNIEDEMKPFFESKH